MKTFKKLLIMGVLAAGSLWVTPAPAQVIDVDVAQVQWRRPYRGGWSGYYGGYYRPYRSYYSPYDYRPYRSYYYNAYRPYWGGYYYTSPRGYYYY